MSFTHLIISRNHLIPNLQRPLLQGPNVKHVTVKHLHVRDLELGLPIDRQHSRVKLLTSLLGVEVGLVEEDAEAGGRGGELVGGGDELGGLVDALDGTVDVAEA